MISLTQHLQLVAPTLDDVFRQGIDDALAGVKPRADYAILAGVRARHGFKRVSADLLTPPTANHKLAGGVVPSYGLTLHHFRTVLELSDSHPRLTLNLCPNAGHCTKVCVLNNGHGGRDSVKRAWRYRTDLVARHPDSFARILAWELVRAVRKHGRILFRPNVNSDAEWQLLLPSLTNGYLPGVLSYGYSKVPATLEGDGWLGSAYRVAYSWNETSDAEAVSAFLARGGAVAVVTSRRKGSPVVETVPFERGASVVADADKTDEWMLARSVIGDLSAKGKARKLIGRSRFVVTAA